MKTLTRTLSTAVLGIALVSSLAACNKANESDSQARNEPNSSQSRNEPNRQVAGESYRPAPAPRVAVTPPPPKCYECGTIVNIEQSKEKGDSSGLGAVIGAVAGAVIGHQIGDGRGQDAATATGVIGGGIAGNEIERRVKGTTHFRVTVAMDNGGTQTVDVAALNGLTTGSKVKVIGNNLQVVGA